MGQTPPKCSPATEAGVLRTLSTASFWRGAAASRAELMERHRGEADDVLRYHQAIGAHESIADALGAGRTLEEIPEFAAWMASAHKPPKGTPDPLDVIRDAA